MLPGSHPRSRGVEKGRGSDRQRRRAQEARPVRRLHPQCFVTMLDVLQRILEVKAEELGRARAARPFAALEDEARRAAPVRDFVAALRSKIATGKLAVIAGSRSPRAGGTARGMNRRRKRQAMARWRRLPVVLTDESSSRAHSPISSRRARRVSFPCSARISRSIRTRSTRPGRRARIAYC